MTSFNSPQTAPFPDPTQNLKTSWTGSVIDKFTQQAARVPEHLALVDCHKHWTYRELDDYSSQLAQQFRNQGLGCQDTLAIYANRSASLVCILVAILKLGAAFIILDSAYPNSRLRECCHLSQPNGLVHLSSAGELPPELKDFFQERERYYLQVPPTPSFFIEQQLETSSKPTNQKINPDDIAYIAFTSGSTGQPKGIIGTHRPLSHFIDWHSRKFNLQEKDRFVLLSGLAHDPLLRDIFTPLWLGATLYIPEQKIMESSGQLAQWMQQQQITIVHLTPAMGLLLTQGLDFESTSALVPSLRYLFWGGDVLTEADIVRSQKLSPGVTNVNFYGTTETPQAMAYYVVPKNLNWGSNNVPIGRGIEDVQLLLIKDDGSLALPGETGEICIRTPYLAVGYLNDDVLTNKKFISNPFCESSSRNHQDRLYKTGDLGRYFPDGNLDIMGRIDNQVKLRGFRIELTEIESVLGKHPDIQRAVVLVQDNMLSSMEFNKQLVAYYLPREMVMIESGELRQFLTHKLPYYMIPQSFVSLQEFPLTPNGKIDRQSLAQLDISLHVSRVYESPKDDLEQQLVTIWQTWLKQKRVGIHDNFFELGGHSLLAIALCRDVEMALNRSIPIAVLFQNPTIQEFAKVLRDDEGMLKGNSIISIQPKGDSLPIFAVHVLGKGLKYYRPLVKYLGDSQPLYGLFFNLLNDAEGSSKGIKELSEIYVRDIKTLQPHGPYYLLGVSIGGRVAFEMAQQLQAQGEEVALLGLIDTTARTGVKHLPPSSRVSGHWGKFQEEGFSYITRKLKSRFGRTQYRLKAIRADIYQRFGRQVPDELKFIAALETNIKIKKKHFPQPYSGRVTLFRGMGRKAEVGTEIDPYYGWRDIAVGGLDIYDIPGDHLLMLQEPNVQVLAEKIKELVQGNNG